MIKMTISPYTHKKRTKGVDKLSVYTIYQLGFHQKCSKIKKRPSFHANDRQFFNPSKIDPCSLRLILIQLESSSQKLCLLEK